MDDIIIVINIKKGTLFIITIIITIIAISHKEKSVIFVIKKVVALISIQIISNGISKNFGIKTENFLEIKTNTIHF